MPHLSTDGLDRLHLRRSLKWSAYAEDVLPLWVAETDFALAEPVRRVLHDAIDRSDTGYASEGDAVATSLADFAAHRWGWEIDPAAVTMAPDVAVACVELLRVLCSPGDRVVINPPVYAPFFGWLNEARCTRVEVPLRAGRLDLAAIEAAYADGAVVHLIANPHNPTGTVHTSDELRDLVALAHRYNVTIVSDEIHAPLALPGATTTPVLTVPGGPETAVSVVSASKAWNLAGLKCAQIVTASDVIADRIAALSPGLPYQVGHLGVIATIAAYDEGRPWLDDLLATLDSRRALLERRLAAELPWISWQPPAATYLAWLDCSALGMGAEPYEWFLSKARVALEPGPKFGAPGGGHVRLNFATSEEILTEALDRMAAVTPP